MLWISLPSVNNALPYELPAPGTGAGGVLTMTLRVGAIFHRPCKELICRVFCPGAPPRKPEQTAAGTEDGNLHDRE